MSSEHPTPKDFAAIVYALAATRGQLSSVLSGQVEHEQLARVLAGTSIANIAQAIGVKEEHLLVEWDEYLSESEKRAIQGTSKD